MAVASSQARHSGFRFLKKNVHIPQVPALHFDPNLCNRFILSSSGVGFVKAHAYLAPSATLSAQLLPLPLQLLPSLAIVSLSGADAIAGMSCC
jgi:hypothetical protein